MKMRFLSRSYVLFFLLLGICISANSQTTISGNIANYAGEDLWVRGSVFDNKIAVNEDGTFSETIDAGDGYFSLYLKRKGKQIYIADGDQVKVNVDAKDFDNSINISGVNTAINGYLAAINDMADSLELPNKELFALEEDAFTEAIQSYYDKKVSYLEQVPDMPTAFINQESDNLAYQKHYRRQIYESYHAYYADKEGFKASENMMNPLQALDYDNEALYITLPYYRRMVDNYHSKGMYDDDNDAFFQSKLALQSPSIRNSVAKSMQYVLSPSSDKLDETYAIIKQLSTNEDFLTKMEAKYQKMKSLGAGNASPQFNGYENHGGGVTSLEDLKGKYVYIDVWATWCGPCLGEIPSLKKVEEQYHDKNIHFVSISIDKMDDREKWVKMVNDKELKGVQLMADKDWKSDFVTDYAIDGIPRFILLDPSGKIVSADAPRPSDEKLIELLNKEGL